MLIDRYKYAEDSARVLCSHLAAFAASGIVDSATAPWTLEPRPWRQAA